MSKTKKTPEKKRSSRVLRGGSWNFGPQYARVAIRDHFSPGYHRYYILGVRLIEVIDEQA